MELKSYLGAALLAAFTVSPVLAAGTTQDIKPADQVGGKRLGELNCKIDGGWGLLLGSSKAATCDFKKVDGTTEVYTGKLSKLGIDIGKTEDAYMTWAVFSRVDVEPGPEALLGSYSGISAEASLGIGLGANALIGGNGKNIGLQPLAIQGNSGLNVAVGLASLSLEATTN
jgi:hypothetical protein